MGIKSYYSNSLENFFIDDNKILGILTVHHRHELENEQRRAWMEQIKILKDSLEQFQGMLFLECFIPRMGKRVDTVVLINGIIFVLEFKIDALNYAKDGIEQVEDYALDLKNFHEGSHNAPIVPILISTKALKKDFPILFPNNKYPTKTVLANADNLKEFFWEIVSNLSNSDLTQSTWAELGYKPTPTIIEAAQTLYRGHNVLEIARSDAGAINLEKTNQSVNLAIEYSKQSNKKSICFITGVPGSGKTLAGLNIATQRSKNKYRENTVFYPVTVH